MRRNLQIALISAIAFIIITLFTFPYVDRLPSTFHSCQWLPSPDLLFKAFLMGSVVIVSSNVI
jgi:hypothetical protein